MFEEKWGRYRQSFAWQRGLQALTPTIGLEETFVEQEKVSEIGRAKLANGIAIVQRLQAETSSTRILQRLRIGMTR
jgi:hypothetical protein